MKSLTKSPSRSHAKSSVKHSTKSPMKIFSIGGSPSHKSSFRTLMKERRQTKSPIKTNHVRISRAPKLNSETGFPKLSDQNHIMSGNTELANLQLLTPGSLASDATRSPFSTRRRLRPLVYEEAVALGTKELAVPVSNTPLAQTIHRESEDSSPLSNRFINQDGHTASLSLTLTKSTERGLNDDLNSSGAVFVEAHLPDQEAQQEAAVTESDLELRNMSSDNGCADQIESAQLASTPDILQPLLHSISHKTFKEISTTSLPDDSLTPAPQLSIEPISSSPEQLTARSLDLFHVTAHAPCVTSPASHVIPQDALEEKSFGFKANNPALSNDADEDLRQASIDNDDKSIIMASSAGDDNSSNDKGTGNESLAMDESEATSIQAPSEKQQFTTQSADNVRDSEDAASKDDQFTVANHVPTNPGGQISNEVDGDDGESLQGSKESMSTRTRSRVRISDETVMLKDFLNRAQARRAAAKLTKTPVSPPGSPPGKHRYRKALQPLDTNSPSPTKASGPGDDPDSPSKVLDEDVHLTEDLSKPISEPTSQRRSARTRLITPAKSPVGAPSLIPLRRPDGTDHVVLPKSANQELSIVTRANTRRNKGRARLPKVMLPELAEKHSHGMGDQDGEGVVHGQRSVTKSVHWDEERLVQYQEAAMAASEGNEGKRVPRMRRLKGLGATNGTPAPKRVARDLLAPTPLSKIQKPKAVAKV